MGKQKDKTSDFINQQHNLISYSFRYELVVILFLLFLCKSFSHSIACLFPSLPFLFSCLPQPPSSLSNWDIANRATMVTIITDSCPIFLSFRSNSVCRWFLLSVYCDWLLRVNGDSSVSQSVCFKPAASYRFQTGEWRQCLEEWQHNGA